MKRINTLFFFSLVSTINIFAALNVCNMKVEHLSSPLGIDTPHPQFSWQLTSDERGCLQENYHIVVTDAGGTQGVVSITYEADTAIVVVGSGEYRFYVSIPTAITSGAINMPQSDMAYDLKGRRISTEMQHDIYLKDKRKLLKL